MDQFPLFSRFDLGELCNGPERDLAPNSFFLFLEIGHVRAFLFLVKLAAVFFFCVFFLQLHV